MAIFSSIFPALPKYPGPYTVGTIELEIPIKQTKNFDLIGTRVETVLVRFFYPAEISSLGNKATAPTWLPQPSAEYAKGYAIFLKQPVFPASHAIHLAVANKRISAIENVPPTEPSEGRLPVMIFSHGLGGSRNAYSTWCGSIASYGVFVAAIEHRDGTAPISVVNAGTVDQYEVPYRRIPEYNQETKHLRTCQLRQRIYEISNLIHVLRDINHGERVVDVLGHKNSLLAQFKGILNTKKGQYIMAGHSFGAATTVAVCKDKQTIDNDYPLKDEFRAAVMLDIWMMVYAS
jgi:platelet-activating factor acetylhydrolase